MWPHCNESPTFSGNGSGPHGATTRRRVPGQSLAVALPLLLMALLAFRTLTGCQSTPQPDTRAAGSTIPDAAAYRPLNATATLQLHSGRFPNLFSGDSQAFWIGDSRETGRDVTALTAFLDDAARLPRREATDPEALLVACRLVSRFSDPSISYDAARMRGVQAQLLLPDGHSVSPITIRNAGAVIGEIHSKTSGFHQTHYLSFPRSLLAHLAAMPPADTTLRLMLKGYDTTYYFAWEMQATE